MSGSPPPPPPRPQSPNPSSDWGAHKKRQRLCPSTSSSFNDPSTADVILRIHPEEDDAVSTYLHLHSPVLRRSKYFDTLLSSRWLHPTTKEATLTLAVSPLTGSVQNYLTVIELLYTNDFSTTITTASAAISLLPVALNLLFEDCVTACVKLLECIPWSEDEERAILSFAPSLKLSESEELLARVSPIKAKCDEDMLYELVIAAIHSNGNMAFAKAFVAKMLREIGSREMVKRVLDRAFLVSFKVVRECLEEYGSPDFRGDNNETEAIQRVHLHTAMKNGRSLLWLVERMIELGVAEMAVVEWSDDQGTFTADLQRAFRDEAWRNIVPGLPAVVLRCTCKLANAVATGSILAPRQVRVKLVKEWLPVLTLCKDNVSPIMSNYKSLYVELEEEFLKIISTLPMSDSQGLLQQCLSFSTRNIDECSHLVTAFNTWFRRAKQPPLQADNHP